MEEMEKDTFPVRHSHCGDVKIVSIELLLQTEMSDLNVQLFSSVFTKTITTSISNTFQTF